MDVGKTLEPEHGFTVLFEDLDARRVVLLVNQADGVNGVSVNHGVLSLNMYPRGRRERNESRSKIVFTVKLLEQSR
jgi:hypothetical protein